MKFQMKTINMADKNLFYTCFVAYLAAVSFGLVIGYSSPALPQMLKTGLVFMFNFQFKYSLILCGPYCYNISRCNDFSMLSFCVALLIALVVIRVSSHFLVVLF